jgi:hypothetical protein
MPSGGLCARLVVFAVMSVGVHANESECWTDIHAAAQEDDTERLAVLLSEYPDDANAEDRCGAQIRPLLLAASSGFSAVVEALISAGATLDAAHAHNGITPLIAAAAAGHIGVVKLLIDAGADLDRPEARNWTALSVSTSLAPLACLLR